MFDPTTDVPKTEAEAIDAIKHGKPQLVGASMVGIFQCRIAQGDSLLRAYETALLAYGDPNAVPSIP